MNKLLNCSIVKLLILIGVIGVIGVIGEVRAAERKVVRVGRDEVVGGDFLAKDGEVIISGKVLGDVYVVSRSLTMDGVVEGSLLGAVGQANISGIVKGNTRLVSANALLDGDIGGNLSILAANLTLTKSATVGGSMVAAVVNFEQAGHIKGRLQSWSRRAVINGTVDGETNVWTKELRLGDRVELNSLTYTSEAKVDIPETATILGPVRFQRPGGRLYQQVEPKKWLARIWRWLTFQTFKLKLISFIIAFVLGWLSWRFFPRFTLETGATVQDSFWVSLLVGGLSLLIVPLLFIALMISIIGIPLAIIFLFALLIALFLGKIYVAVAIGRRLGSFGSLGTLGLGLIVYYLLTSLPVVGMLLAVTLSLTGFGALLITKLAWYQKLSRKKLV